MIYTAKFISKISIHVGLIFLLLILGCQRELSRPKSYDITCYAATYGKGVYRSDNGGISWFPVDTDQKDIYAYFKRIYLSPDNKDLLYVTTTGAGLFLFELRTRELEGVGKFRDSIITSIAFKDIPTVQQGKNKVLVAGNKIGIFETQNEFEAWHPSNNGLTYRDVNVLLTRGEDLFAGTAKDLFKRGETSKQWMAASEGIKNKNILSIDFDPQDKILYAGSGPYEGEKGRFEDIPCLYKSTDQGRTWVASDEGIQEGTLIYIICVNPIKPERIYLGTSNGIFLSTNSGKRWEKMENGLPRGLKLFDIKIARMSDNMDLVYAAGSKGVFMTIDNDNTLWLNKSYGLERTAITSIVLLPD
ncbi:MAG: hypothetical protein JRC68_07310 [Deltaproteobacteria bacterium]|nr:hypothetical protein [Deltaproteobacteria bacterium]